MSATAEISFAWADGEHCFRLALGQLRELQDKTGVGPMRLLLRISQDDWQADDLIEVLRLGLIGGGMTHEAALALVQRYVAARPLSESVRPALLILGAALYGVPDDPIRIFASKKTKAAGDQKMDASPSPQSTARRGR